MDQFSLPHFMFAGHFEGGSVPFHSHNGHELCWVTQGECHLHMGGQRLPGAAGTLFVVPQGTPHKQEASDVCTSYLVFQLPNPNFNTTARLLSLSLDLPIRGWMNDLCAMSLANTRPSPAIAGALTLAFLEFIRSIEAAADSPSGHPALEMALSWMQSHLDAPLKVPEIAEHTHLSASHLSELFHRQFGCGPHGYHQKLRLERAARLLGNPYLRVAEIGRTCGFEDANYFARQFQKHHGRSPAAYRREKHPESA